MDVSIFKKLGFSDKAASVYLALLRFGPNSVRSLAELTELNRGTTYDTLKWLQDQEVVAFYKQDAKQLFMAADPARLQKMIQNKEEELAAAETALEKLIPELSALYHSGGERPVARYIEKESLGSILEDVLSTCEASEEKLYRIYSTAGLREYLYTAFPTFSDVRVAKGIAVRAIAIGDGGELRGLDERKWLKATDQTPTYIIMYPGKTAYVSLRTNGDPVGVIIENKGISETQKLVFDTLWERL